MSLSAVKRVAIDNIDATSIKKILIELGSPIIPLAIVFEVLGFKGVSGIEWGILAGAISALATELGYKVQKVGRSIILIKGKEDLAKKEDVAAAINSS